MGAPAFDQLAFRLRNDDGSITAATYMGTGNNENQTIDWDAPFRVRFVIDEYNDKTALITPNLYINYNGGGWEDIATCPEVDWATSAYVSDGTVISVEELGTTPSNGAFNNGEYDQNGTVALWTLTAKGDYSEFEFCLTIDSAAATDGHTFQLRVYNGAAALDLYTNEPTITVNATAADVNVYPVAVAAGADAVGPLIGSVGEVFVLDFEEEDTSDFDEITDGGSNLAVNVAAAMVGSFGLEITYDGVNTARGAMVTTSVAPFISTGEIRFRFYFDPNNVDPNAGIVAIFNATADGSYGGITSLGWARFGGTQGSYTFYMLAKDDANVSNSLTDTALSDAEHYIEVYMKRETSDGAADGILRAWIDGIEMGGALTGVENYNIWPTLVGLRYGLTFGLDAGSSGSVYLDDIIARDDSTEIGGVGVNVSPAAVAAGADSIDPTTQLGSIDYTPTVDTAGADSINPTTQLGDVSFTPAVGAAGADSIAPSVQQDSMNVTPAILSAGADSVNPTTQHGSINITPAVGAAGADSIDPTVTIGSPPINITPPALTAGADSVVGEVRQGPVTITPAVSVAGADSIDPTTNQGDIDLTPTVVSGAAASIDPSVLQDSMNVTPAVLAAGADSLLGETQQGGLDITPAVSSASVTIVEPSVEQDSMDVTPAVAAAGADSIGPSVQIGSPPIYPDPVAAGADSVLGEVRQGSINITPAVDSAGSDSVDPSVLLSSVSVTPGAATAGADSVDPTVQILGGGEDVYPAAVAAAASTVDPSIGLSSTSASPSASSAGTDASVLTVRLGNVSITPAIDTAGTDGFHTETRLGSVFSSPAPVSASVESVDPTVNISENFINITPPPAVAGAGSVDPTAHQGDLDLSPSVVQSATSAVLGDVTQDSMDVYPAAGAAGTATVDPLISISGGNFVAVSWARIRIPASGINVTPRPASARTNTEGNVKVTIQTSSVIITVTAPTIDLTQVHVLTVTSGVIGITSDTVVLAQEHQLLVHRAVINVTAQTIQLGFPILYPLIKDGAVNSGISKDLEVNSAIIGVGNVTSRLIVEGEVNSRIEADLEITERLEVPNGS